MDTIAERLDFWLSEHKISGYKISKDLGISSSLVSAWRRGIKEPTYESLIKLQIEYELPAHYILTGDLKSIEEMKLIKLYNQLSEEDQEYIIAEIRKRLG